jgi:DNA-binding NarL/FixJ family response regulator
MGYLSKTESFKSLVGAIKQVMRGNRVVVAAAPGAVPPRPAPRLTHQEQELLRLLQAGHTQTAAARTLHQSARTVARRLAALRTRFQARSTMDLVRRAERRGWLAPHAASD